MQITTSLVKKLTTDPELRHTPAGHAACTLRVAVNDRVQDRTTGQGPTGPSPT